MNLQYKLEKSRRVINVELLTGRTAVISSSTNVIDEEKLDDRIIKLSYEDSIFFKLGDIFDFKLESIISKFEIKEIIRNDTPGRYYCTCSLDTYTNYFLFPLISQQTTQNRDYFKFDNFVIGAYLDKELQNIILLARYFPTVEFSKWEENIKSNQNYIGFIDPNTYTVGYKFRIPRQHLNIISLFIEGKYSSFDECVKKKIINFHNAKKDSELYEILYKSSHRKSRIEHTLGIRLSEDIDLYSKPNMNNEILEL